MQLRRTFLQQCLVFSTGGVLFQLYPGKLQRLVQFLAYPAQRVVIYRFIHNDYSLPSPRSAGDKVAG